MDYYVKLHIGYEVVVPPFHFEFIFIICSYSGVVISRYLHNLWKKSNINRDRLENLSKKQDTFKTRFCISHFNAEQPCDK